MSDTLTAPTQPASTGAPAEVTVCQDVSCQNAPVDGSAFCEAHKPEVPTDAGSLNSPDGQGIAAADASPNATDPDAAYEYVGDGIRYKAPKEGVIRSVDLTPTSGGDGLTLEGYAAVFEEPCEIDSWEGHFSESISRGAFAKTISERTPVLLFDHGMHPYIGKMPIGKITEIREDSRGLFVRARLTESSMTEPVRAAIASGAVSGMSVRMNIVKENWSGRLGGITQRSIKEVGLIELGPVVFPAYESTSVSTRSRPDDKAAADTAAAAADTADEPVAADHSWEIIRNRARALLLGIER